MSRTLLTAFIVGSVGLAGTAQAAGDAALVGALVA